MRAEEFVAAGGGATGPTTEAAADPNAPLFSLPLGEGAGALLAAAAGDVAGGAHPAGYSWVTQSATVLAYHLMQVGAVERERLARELVTLDGTEDGVHCYRGESAAFRAWLDSVHAGDPAASPDPSAEPAARVTPVGVWFRKQPEELVEAAVASARLTHLDAATVVAAAAVAGAVAGSCYVQSGRDLVLGASETAERALVTVEEQAYRYADTEGAVRFVERLRALSPVVGSSPREIVLAVSDDNGPVGVDGALLGILLGASKLNDSVRLIEAGAMAGGSEVGAIVGAVVGARSGLVRWPWRVPNDTWFAEIGRRLVNHTSEVRDLPIPFAVEERMTLAIRTTPSTENL